MRKPPHPRSTRSNNAYSFVQANANVADTVNGLNQLTTSGISHDARGNISAIGGVGFGYSSENQLISAGSDDSFGRDPLGRMYYSTEDPQLTRFLFDGDVLIAEYDSGQDMLRRYVQGPDGEPIAWYEGSGTSTRRYFHADERGSVIAVSDNSGKLLAGGNFSFVWGQGFGGRFCRKMEIRLCNEGGDMFFFCSSPRLGAAGRTKEEFGNARQGQSGAGSGAGGGDGGGGGARLGDAELRL